MSKKLRIVLIIAFSCTLVVSLAFLAIIYFEYRAGDKLYEDSRTQYVRDIKEMEYTEDYPVPEEPDAEAPVIPEPGIVVDFDGLSEINPDIFAWIFLPETEINYPLLLGVDNKKYIRAAYDGSYSRFGSIFMDKVNKEDLSDRHIIIYGHNMGNGAMFHDLLNYSDQSYLDEHPVVYIITKESYRKYQVFSAHKTHVNDGVFAREFENTENFRSLLDLIKNESLISSDIIPTTDDKILTLSTCTTSTQRSPQRFVVHAVLIEEELVIYDFLENRKITF